MEVRLLSLPTHATLAAAHDTEPPPHRELTVVYVEVDGVPGWGECSALNRPTYTHEWARGAFDLLSGLVGAALTDRLADAPMAAAAVESALLDAHLRATGQSLATWLADRLGGAEIRQQVPAGVALGLAAPDMLGSQAIALSEAGFGRVKLKIEPGSCIESVAAVRRAVPNVELHIDGNGSFAAEDLDVLCELVELGVRAIEQPFAADDVASAAALVRRVSVPVVADEAVNDLADVQRLHAIGALSGVSLKAAKVGGLQKAIDMLRWCADNGVVVTAGGMLESGLGRHQLAALAALPQCTLTGDVSPAGRWLAEDPWPDLVMSDGHITTPTEPGIAPLPDQATLDAFTVAKTTS